MTELRACIKRKCDVIIPSYSTARPNFRFAPGFGPAVNGADNESALRGHKIHFESLQPGSAAPHRQLASRAAGPRARFLMRKNLERSHRTYTLV